MQKTNYDSDFCGSLPIHRTNLIQPYGALLVIDRPTGMIVQASENVDQLFGNSVSEVVNTSLQQHIGADAYEGLQKKFTHEFKDKIPAVLPFSGKHLLTLIHGKQNYLLVEIDLEQITLGKQETFIEIYQELKYAMVTIENATSIQEACNLAAAELKRLSGFDKVMIYRFDDQWNGNVIAEVKEESMESYLGFTFPASDIPRQARELYLKNPYRFIPDREYKPVKLFPVINPMTDTFLDLSECNVRSVAAVHLEYLKNMNVVASMSTRILKDEKLWGLIACHHQTPKYMSYEMCSIFEMLSSIISVKIASLENQSQHALDTSLTQRYTQLIEDIYKSGNIDQTLLSEKGLIKLLNGSGVVITRHGKIMSTPTAPPAEFLDELILWLHTRELKKNFHTDNLSDVYEQSRSHQEIASGILVIPINYQRDQYIIVFRPEILKVINWGGNPHERIQFEQDQKNYHPRNSFHQWQQLVSGTALPWRNEEIKIAESLRSFIYEFEASHVARG